MAAKAVMVCSSGRRHSHLSPAAYWAKPARRDSALVDLPLPFIIGPSVWNRPSILFAWMLVLTASFMSRRLCHAHFKKDLLPAKADSTGAASRA